MNPEAHLQRDDRVVHPRFGEGSVISDEGMTVVVRFEEGIHECIKQDLTVQPSLLQGLASGTWHPPHEVIARCLANSIESINDGWGVFSRSRIALLPHQLWVCHQVLKSWPTRWLVADDVGLGKTIEAGLILWPLLSKKTVQRLLILCPASLVGQWQYRLRTMFDIRVAVYAPELDTEKSDYWHTQPMVIASVHTLRGDRNGRHDRLLLSDPWDLVIVDEAHHLNYDEDSGATLAYRLLEKLVENNKIKSMVFFTGTPHRGKDFGFLSLLQLLRPDLFQDAKKPMQHYLSKLPQVLIRNNKYNVTDLQGNRIFQAPNVTNDTYEYSPEERRFYDMMTEFISTGKAYASTLGHTDSRTATLVLIALQKLASSSVAAVQKALAGRLGRLKSITQRVAELKELKDYYELQERGEDDRLAEIEEILAETASSVQLMEDEQQRLEELLAAAYAIKEETKIRRIVELVKERFAGRAVLFFTEYKATQSLLMSTLMTTFGKDSTTFINGDGRAEHVLGKTMYEKREHAAELFNEGRVRFLVSTEAAGEGIDLQRNCHTLIHVDLPWNPMRLHQRVGRINRYGQTKQVEVVALRNPATVESRIWDKLNVKIDRIQRALSTAMDEPEDLLQLVLGMTSSSFFSNLFSEAHHVPKESFSTWFDQASASFGGRDVIETVEALVGHSAKFDYQAISAKIPRLDLPDLEPFFRTMLMLNKRRVSTVEHRLSFITPDTWRNEFGIMPKYEGVGFMRERSSNNSRQEHVFGIGHKVFDKAVEQAKALESFNALIPASLLAYPLAIFKIMNRLTTDETPVRTVVVGLELADGIINLLHEEALFRRLCQLVQAKSLDGTLRPRFDTAALSKLIEDGYAWIEGNMGGLELPFVHPALQLHAVLCPASQDVGEEMTI